MTIFFLNYLQMEQICVIIVKIEFVLFTIEYMRE